MLALRDYVLEGYRRWGAKKGIQRALGKSTQDMEWALAPRPQFYCIFLYKADAGNYILSVLGCMQPIKRTLTAIIPGSINTRYKPLSHSIIIPSQSYSRNNLPTWSWPLVIFSLTRKLDNVGDTRRRRGQEHIVILNEQGRKVTRSNDPTLKTPTHEQIKPAETQMGQPMYKNNEAPTTQEQKFHLFQQECTL
jgi:hypothetical protein